MLFEFVNPHGFSAKLVASRGARGDVEIRSDSAPATARC
jgi:hypothetical protein